MRTQPNTPLRSSANSAGRARVARLARMSLYPQIELCAIAHCVPQQLVLKARGARALVSRLAARASCAPAQSACAACAGSLASHRSPLPRAMCVGLQPRASGGASAPLVQRGSGALWGCRGFLSGSCVTRCAGSACELPLAVTSHATRGSSFIVVRSGAASIGALLRQDDPGKLWGSFGHVRLHPSPKNRLQALLVCATGSVHEIPRPSI